MQLLFTDYETEAEITMLSIFFDPIDGGNKINSFVDSLSMLLRGSKPLVGIPLNVLIDRIEKDEFYVYNGSTTTPPCEEGVRWLVAPHP